MTTPSGKPVDAMYIKTQLKNFDTTILENKYGKIKQISQEDYEKLNDEKKKDGTVYFIYDMDNIEVKNVSLIDVKPKETFLLVNNSDYKELDGKILKYNFDFKKGLVDTLNGVEATLEGGASLSNRGLELISATSRCDLSKIFKPGQIILLKTGEFNANFSGTHGRLLTIWETGANIGAYASGFIYRSTGNWTFYSFTDDKRGTWSTDTSLINKNEIQNSILKFSFSDITNKCTLSINDNFVCTTTCNFFESQNNLSIGANANGFYNAVIEKIEIYE